MKPLTFLGLLLVCANIHGEFRLYSGNDLLKMEKSCSLLEGGIELGTPKEILDCSTFLGYILGSRDSYATSTMWNAYVDPLCIPDGVSLEQLSKVVAKSFKEQPENLHLSGSHLVVKSIKEAFACPEEQEANSQKTLWGFIDDIAVKKRVNCMKAFSNQKFCSCLSENLPFVVSVAQYVHIITHTKAEIGYSQLTKEERGAIDLIFDTREKCVATSL